MSPFFIMLFCCGAAGGLGVCRILRLFYPLPGGNFFLWLLLLAGGILALWSGRKAPRQFLEALFPLWGLLLPLPGGWYLALAVILISGTVFRLLPLLPHRTFPQIPEKYGLLLAFVITAGATAFSFCAQSKAFNNWFLIFQDWGEYSANYLKLAFGGGNLKLLLCNAGHFNLLPNLLMTAALWLCPAPETVFFCNALAIGSAGVLAYWLGRAEKLTVNGSLLLAFCGVFYPVFTRQSLSLFYGYHPVIFFVPLLMGFFIFRAKGNRTGAVICALASLFVQETVAVFWFGWGVYELFRKNWKTGAFWCAGTALWFLLLSLWIQPWASSAGAYAQNFHFAHLGNSMGELLLSPLTRPAAFWGTLFTVPSLFFAFTLFAPAGAVLCRAPERMIPALPILAGVMLQGSHEVKSVMLQYGLETSTLFLCAAIAAIGPMGKRQIRGAMAALFCGTLLSWCFWGFHPWESSQKDPDASSAVAYLKKNLPQNMKRLHAPNRLRGHFMFEYPTVPLGEPVEPGDCVLFDLHDPLFEFPEKTESLRRKLLALPGVKPVTHVNWYGKQLTLFYRSENQREYPGLPRISAQVFRKLGRDLPVNVPGISCVFDGARLIFRIDRKQRGDYEVEFSGMQNGMPKKFNYTFGFGLFPAWHQQEGALWAVPLPRNFTLQNLVLKERPCSRRD